MSLILSIFASDILPVFAIAGAGYLLARFGGADVKTLARVVFYALLPCLAFQMVLSSAGQKKDYTIMILLAALVMSSMAAVGFLTGKAIGLSGVDLRAFLMVVMFSNGGNYGLPVVRFAFGPEALSYATIFFLSGAVMTYFASAFFAGSHESKWKGALDKIWRMPALYGVALALAIGAAGVEPPAAIARPVAMLSDASLPLMILVLGMQLERAARPRRPWLVAVAVGISLLAAPLVALGLSALFGLTGAPKQAVVTLSSMPVAVITTILALEFDLSPDFVTSAVFVSTLASPLTLAPLIAYLR